ncbi:MULTISPECIES: hypothetical protein [unclassified Neorhizobium]|uniref:hypothetical protein n=1 Tax=unclassified Neorhizobium TaxID=2629175 RepID=UPI001FF0DFF4|nr:MULTISPECIES: hypothetical protein [unclassified Neorhizobium]MCJ9673706.1 hypothetical protein [Neorhizobium sp. SHOUNA12B]MCJ9746572.1 hypothetical protein [Neorhizobium sp. SHOUNA12A]
MHDNFRNLDFDPRNLPAKYLEAIGLAVACSAQTEDHMQLAITGCLGLDGELGWAITSHMTVPLRENVLKSVAEIKIDSLDDLDQLDELIDKVKLAAERRNAIVHNLWCRDEKTNDVFLLRTTARNTVKVDLVPMPLDTIIDDAKFIYGAGIELLNFLLSKGLMPSLPPRDRPRFHKTKAARKKRAKD